MCRAARGSRAGGKRIRQCAPVEVGEEARRVEVVDCIRGGTVAASWFRPKRKMPT